MCSGKDGRDPQCSPLLHAAIQRPDGHQALHLKVALVGDLGISALFWALQEQSKVLSDAFIADVWSTVKSQGPRQWPAGKENELK